MLLGIIIMSVGDDIIYIEIDFTKGYYIRYNGTNADIVDSDNEPTFNVDLDPKGARNLENALWLQKGWDIDNLTEEVFAEAISAIDRQTIPEVLKTANP